MGMMAWFDYGISCSSDEPPMTRLYRTSDWEYGRPIEIPEIEEKKVIVICSYCGVEQEWQPHCIGCHAPLHRKDIIDDDDEEYEFST